MRLPFRFLLILALLAPANAFAKAPTVLFVCQFGSVKSPVARELFRKRARERGIAVTAFSRGITPEAHVAPLLRTALDAEGVNPERDGLHKLSRGSLRRATITVLFDRLPSGWAANRAQDWTDTGSLNQAYAAEKPRLLARIDALLDTIALKSQSTATGEPSRLRKY